MTFILPNNASPALVRQFNDPRPYWLRVNHWLYALISQRQLAGSSPTPIIHDNIHQWRKKYQAKSSLNLVSTNLTKDFTA